MHFHGKNKSQTASNKLCYWVCYVFSRYFNLLFIEWRKINLKCNPLLELVSTENGLNDEGHSCSKLYCQSCYFIKIDIIITR